MSEQSENENRVEIEERNLWSLKVEGMISDKSTNRKGDSVVRLIDQIVSDRNLDEAIKAVRRNKGAAGVDGMQVEELDRYFEKHRAEIKAAILSKKYKPDPVRRVYIPKAWSFPTSSNAASVPRRTRCAARSSRRASYLCREPNRVRILLRKSRIT